MGNSCVKIPQKKLVNRHDPPQYSSVGRGDLNIYNRFGITEYKQKWIVSTNIIYASKKSLVYPCAKIKKGCCYSKPRYDCVLKVADYSQNEITCLHKLNHPNIVKALDIYHNSHGMLIVFPYYPEGDLMDVLRNYKLKGDEKKSIMCQIINGLFYMHRERIAHGDLKIENILLKKKGKGWHVYIADFGLSVHPEILPPFDQPPELHTTVSGPTDHFAMDVWNVGIIMLHLYECSVEDQLLAKSLSEGNQNSALLKSMSRSYPSLTDITLSSSVSREDDSLDESVLLETNPFQTLLPHLLDKNPASRWTIRLCQEWILQNVTV